MGENVQNGAGPSNTAGAGEGFITSGGPSGPSGPQGGDNKVGGPSGPSGPSGTAGGPSGASGPSGATGAAPAELELKLPDGVDVKDAAVVAAVADLKGLAKSAELSPKQAQAVADAYFKARTAAAEASKAEESKAEQVRQGWAATIKADPDIGGAKYAESQALAGRVMQQFGSKELGQLLQVTGLHNHPDLARFFVKVGRAISEDSMARGQDGKQQQPTPKTPSNDLQTLERALWPTWPAVTGAAK